MKDQLNHKHRTQSVNTDLICRNFLLKNHTENKNLDQTSPSCCMWGLNFACATVKSSTFNFHCSLWKLAEASPYSLSRTEERRHTVWYKHTVFIVTLKLPNGKCLFFKCSYFCRYVLLKQTKSVFGFLFCKICT